VTPTAYVYCDNVHRLPRYSIATPTATPTPVISLYCGCSAFTLGHREVILTAAPLYRHSTGHALPDTFPMATYRDTPQLMLYCHAHGPRFTATSPTATLPTISPVNGHAYCDTFHRHAPTATPTATLHRHADATTTGYLPPHPRPSC
jgi:hypothetical protein